MLRENGNKIFVGLFGGAILALGLIMFAGCGDDPACTDTGVDTDVSETGITETGTTETGTTETGTTETGTTETGTTETGDTGVETGDTGVATE